MDLDVIQWSSLLSSGVETTTNIYSTVVHYYMYVYICMSCMNVCTDKFAHMNGHWKAYDFICAYERSLESPQFTIIGAREEVWVYCYSICTCIVGESSRVENLFPYKLFVFLSDCFQWTIKYGESIVQCHFFFALSRMHSLKWESVSDRDRLQYKFVFENAFTLLVLGH